MSTPECPGCGAKFQHDISACVCKRCGLPDEVIAAGPEAVGRWMRRAARAGQPAAVEAVHGRTGKGGSHNRRRKAHGRVGAVRKS
jgi:hypothetical protein